MKRLLAVVVVLFSGPVFADSFKQIFGTPDEEYFVIECTQHPEDTCTIRAYTMLDECSLISSLQTYGGENVRSLEDGHKWLINITETEDDCVREFQWAIRQDAMMTKMTLSSAPGQQCQTASVTKELTSSLPEGQSLELPVTNCDSISIIH